MVFVHTFDRFNMVEKKKEKTLQSAADSSYNLPKCTALLVYKMAYTIVYNC